MIDYSTLNPEQHKAVFSMERYILCLAGAGTGKTQVLAFRIARLWEGGVSTENILALTFTRAAGAEMKERVIGLIGEDGKNLFANTFHAFCVDVIRSNAEALGYEPNFTVYDQTECDEVMQDVLQSLKLKIPVKRITDFRAGRTENMKPGDKAQAERAIKEYEYRLRRNNAIDFDGLISMVRNAVQNNEAIRKSLNEKYSHIFVDEFQDTDSDQWAIVEAIKPKCIFIVGDDFQAIYGFRGGEISIILGLAENPLWHVVKLERNYRSTEPIVAAANALIGFNKQTEKRLISNTPGASVHFWQPKDEHEEIAALVPQFQQNIASKRTFAILARTNRQLDYVKTVLKSLGIPFEAVSAVDHPLASSAAKELLAWIAALYNPADDAAMRKIALPICGKKIMHDAELEQLTSGNTLLDALCITDGEGHGTFADLYLAVKGSLNGFSNFVDVIDFIAAASGTYDRVVANNALSVIIDWHSRQNKLGEPATIADLLEWVRLSNIADKPTKERDPSKVQLMTVHGSKGLEFDAVYIIGAAQGAFPNQGDLQEERRLFYVAMTRAKIFLTISCPQVMQGWNGKAVSAQPSQFIAEAGLQ